MLFPFPQTVTLMSHNLHFAVEKYHTDDDLEHAVDRIQQKVSKPFVVK